MGFFVLGMGFPVRKHVPQPFPRGSRNKKADSNFHSISSDCPGRDVRSHLMGRTPGNLRTWRIDLLGNLDGDRRQIPNPAWPVGRPGHSRGSAFRPRVLDPYGAARETGPGRDLVGAQDGPGLARQLVGQGGHGPRHRRDLARRPACGPGVDAPGSPGEAFAGGDSGNLGQRPDGGIVAAQRQSSLCSPSLS